MTDKKDKKKKSNKKKVTKKKTSEKEEFCEVFDVDKKGKRKVVKKCGSVPVKHSSKKESNEYNKILRNVLIGLFIIMLFIIGIFISNNYLNKIHYEGIEFQKIKQGEIDLFYSRFPVDDNKYFNMYLRNNPEKIESIIDFNGNLSIKKHMVINSKDQFHCSGYGIVSIANLKQFYDALGVNVIKDENASCDEQGRYTYVNITKGNKTQINQYGPSCYNIVISDCEILKGTERFILEGISELKKARPELF